MARLYAIKTPKGKLMDSTLSCYPWLKFSLSINDLPSELTWEAGDVAALIRAAKKAGYKKVRVWLTEEKPG